MPKASRGKAMTWVCVAALRLLQPTLAHADLVFQQAVVDGDGSVKGVSFAHAVALSPDGRHVYVTGDGIAAFARNPADQSVTYLDAVLEPLNGEAWSVAVSPDGQHVYVGTEFKVVALRRDATTGKLAQFATYNLMNLVSPSAMAISGDGRHVYVATCWNPQAVRVFSRDPTTGELTSIGGSEDAGNPSHSPRTAAAALSPDDQHLYVACDNFAFGVTVFRRDATSGGLTVIGPVSDSNSGALGVAVSPDGRHAYITDRQSNKVKLFGRDPASGALTLIDTYVVPPFGEPMAVAVSPDGRSVFVANDSGGVLAAFRRDLVTGGLTYVDGHRDLIVRAIAVAPDSSSAYVATHSGVGALRRHDETGALVLVNTLQEGDGGVHLRDATSVAVSPDGAFVYLAGGEIVAFRRDLVTGRLTSMEVVEPGYRASTIALSPDGHNAYVASSSTVMVYERDATSGGLRLVETKADDQDGVDGLHGAVIGAVSPDGRNVYVLGQYEAKIAVFQRDPDHGSLTFLHTLVDGARGVNGLMGPSALVVSADGRYVYAAGRVSNRLLVFEREPTRGGLTILQLVSDQDTPGFDVLWEPTGLALSPDGAHLYVLAGISHGIGVFRRDADTGRLTFASRYRDDNIYFNDRGIDVAVSPDGRRVFAIGFGGSLLSFNRDPVAGALVLEQKITPESPGVEGLLAPADVHVSPDGANVYVAAARGPALVAFRIRDEGGRPCLDGGGCESSSCVDGLCCTLPCRGPGESCVLPDHYGICVAGCVGDCSGNRVCSIDELVTAVRIGLGTSPMQECPIADANGDGHVHISELIVAVGNALAGCHFNASGVWQQEDVALGDSTCNPALTTEIMRLINTGVFECRYEVTHTGNDISATETCGTNTSTYDGSLKPNWELTLHQSGRQSADGCTVTATATIALQPNVSQTSAVHTILLRFSDRCGLRNCRLKIDTRWTRQPPTAGEPAE